MGFHIINTKKGILYIAEYIPVMYSPSNIPKKVMPIAPKTLALNCVKKTYSPLFIISSTEFQLGRFHLILYLCLTIIRPITFEINGETIYKKQ